MSGRSSGPNRLVKFTPSWSPEVRDCVVLERCDVEVEEWAADDDDISELKPGIRDLCRKPSSSINVAVDTGVEM